MPINIDTKLLDEYVKKHIHPGSFFQAVLENNLFEAIYHANEVQLLHLKDVCMYIHWEIPSFCHGSKEIVAKWINNKT